MRDERKDGLAEEARAAHELLSKLGLPTHRGPDQGESGPIERLTLCERIIGIIAP